MLVSGKLQKSLLYIARHLNHFNEKDVQDRFVNFV